MTIKYWTALTGFYEFDYDVGSHSPVAGEVIKVDGEEGTEYATIQSWTVAGGAWGTNDATGKMWVHSATAAFIANLENNDVIEDSGGTKICDTTGGVTDTEGDWQTAGNWGTGEDPAVPVATDVVIFDGRSTISVADGIAVGETGGVDFVLLHVKKTYTGDIGASDERLHTSCVKIIIEGSGTYYIECSEDATGKDQAIVLVIVNNKSATMYLTSNENTGSWCCEFTEVIVVAGTVEIGDTNIDTAVQYLRLATRTNRSDYAVVTVHEDCERYKATTYKITVQMSNGTLTMDSGATLIEQYNGNLEYGSDLGTSPETGLDIETLLLYGGSFNWHPDDSGNDAYISDGWIFGGTFNASSSTNADRTRFIGNGAGNDFHIFEGATFNIASNYGNVELAASSQIWNFGGTILMDNYTEISIDYDKA